MKYLIVKDKVDELSCSNCAFELAYSCFALIKENNLPDCAVNDCYFIEDKTEFDEPCVSI
jgi:hypothetical protein